MESNRCQYCDHPAVYQCLCKFPSVIFCKSHQDIHIEEQSDHKFQKLELYKKCLDPLTSSKNNLIRKIEKVRIESKLQKRQTIAAQSQLIDAVNEQAKTTLRKLKNFSKICKGLLTNISNTSFIDDKIIMSPLESILLSENIENFLEMIYPPQVKFPDPLGLKFEYFTSIFPHFLFNSSNYSVGFTKKERIQVFPNKKEFSVENLHVKSRVLVLSNGKALVTGGLDKREMAQNNVFMLDLNNKEIINLPPMRQSRHSHTMAWVNNFPVVIGGFSEGLSLKSSEIFVDTAWLSLPDLNFARNSLSAISSLNSVYVIGGMNNKKVVNFIEKFVDYQWIVLEIYLPKPCFNIGLCCIETNLLLIGGIDQDGATSRDVYCLDLDKGEVMLIGLLKVSVCIPNSHFVVKDNKLFCFGYEKNNSVSLIDLGLENIKLR